MKHINFIKKNPFFIFEIDNFLTEKLYNGLNMNFPDIYKTNIDVDYFKNGKFGFDTSSKLYLKYLNENEYIKQLHDLIFSEKFFNFFYSQLYLKFLMSRKNSFKHILKLLRKPKIVKKIDKSNLSYYLNLKTEMRIEMQFSFIKNNGKIVPHTDSGEKLLSMMLYFPQYEKDKKFYEVEKKYGTVFWKSDCKNFNNKHQDGNDEKIFLANTSNEVIYKSEFVGNKLFGFIKNPYSWHSVDPVNVQENYIRRSININFYF